MVEWLKAPVLKTGEGLRLSLIHILDDFGEQTLDEIMGQYEASVLRAFYAQSVSYTHLNMLIDAQHFFTVRHHDMQIMGNH